jgi:hypothetical protein
MKAISAAAGVNGRVDIFFLDDARGMHWVSPDGVPNLGGIFTSAPVVVSAYVEPPEVTDPGPVTNPHPVVDPHPVKGPHPVVDPHPVKGPHPVTGPRPVTNQLANKLPAAVGGASASAHPPSEAALIHGVEDARVHVQQLDVFGLGLDYAMYHTRLVNDDVQEDVNDTVPWQSLGGVFTSTPAAIAWGNDRVDVFGVGLDRGIYTKSIVGSQLTSDWQSLGGVFTSAASVVSQKAGQLDLFARGSDFTLRHNQLNGAQWFGWQNLGGNLASPPVAVSWGENRVDVFAIFNDRALWHRWWDGQIWNDWESLGGQYSEEPGVATWGPGRLDVFVLGDPHLAGEQEPDREIYHHWFSDGAWNSPVSLQSANPDHAVFGAPTVVSSGPNRLTVLAPGLETPAHDGFASQTLLQLGSSTEVWGDGEVGSATGPTGWGSRLGPVHLPNQGIVSLDIVKVIEQRSGLLELGLESDTDYASASVAIGNWPSVTAVQALGDLKSNQEGQTNLLSLGPTTMELAELVSFNYLVINNGSAEPAKAMAALAQGANSLNQGSVTSISKQIQSGVTKIVEVGIDSVLESVPVVGSIVAPIANWLLDQLSTIVFANCDGLVAAELRVFPGKPDPSLELVEAPVTHPGTDSAIGCGSNSVYEVWRTVETGITTTRLNA